MVDTLKIYEDLQETMDAAAARKIAGAIGMVYEDLKHTVTKQEFGELKDVMQELAEAQKRTEARVEELAAAQARLAAAQERTEGELHKLAQEVRALSRAHDETRKQLGGLATDFGYTLENEAFKALPKLLKRDYGILIKGRLKRENVQDKTGEFIEINISGQARRNGTSLTIVGESKSKLSKKNVDDFIRKKLNRLAADPQGVFSILVTHMTSSPGIEEYAKRKGIAVYYSYDF